MVKKKPVKTKKKNLRQMAFTRFMLIIAVFIIWIGAIGVRLVHLQVNQHEWLSERALGQRQDVKKARALRGTIYDRNDHALAMSVNVKTLYADPSEIVDPAAAVRDIAKVVKVDAAALTKQLSDAKAAGKRYLSIAKKLDDATVQKVNKTLQAADVKKADQPNYAGLHWTDDQKRSYPNGTLAANILGFSNAEDEGQAGIERSQDDLLHGELIKKTQDRDRLGRVYDETVDERQPPKDVVLTISNSIQYKTEQALAEGVKTANAKSGMAIVIDQKNGEILALANYPTFDPDDISTAKPETMMDRAIQTVYSPGSVFKLVTYSSALEKNLITPDGTVDAGNGSIEVAGHKFSDHHTGSMSYSQALAVSSNISAIKTGMRVGKEDFYNMVQRMGFGAKTGVELPAETGGIVRSPERWNGDSLASMSIGYEIGVTALQMASAFATIANDGVRFQPHIIKEIRQQDDTVISAAQPVSTRVVSPETAANLRRMLRQVVLTGTGKRAQLNGYTCAGKTGTAWKFDSQTKRVESSKYVSSFIGFAPYENPDVTIAVVMDEPQVAARDGGMVSAPVFKQIAESVLPELNVEPSGDVKPAENLTAENIPETAGDAGELKKTLVADTPDEDDANAPVKDSKEVKDKKEVTDKRTAKPVVDDKKTEAKPKTLKETPEKKEIKKDVKKDGSERPRIVVKNPTPAVEPKRKQLAKPPTEKTKKKT